MCKALISVVNLLNLWRVTDNQLNSLPQSHRIEKSNQAKTLVKSLAQKRMRNNNLIPRAQRLSSLSFLILLIINNLHLVDSACPNLCNGHGLCNSETNTCECEDTYNIAADCSLGKSATPSAPSWDNSFFYFFFVAICPSGYAFVDKAYDVNAAHQLTECSNRGICNRETVSDRHLTEFH